MENLICKCSNCDKGFCKANVACFKEINLYNCVDSCFGCYNNDIQAFQCGKRTSNGVKVDCCSDKNFCNSNLTIDGEYKSQKDIQIKFIAFSISAFFILLFVLLFFIYIKMKKLKNKNIFKHGIIDTESRKKSLEVSTRAFGSRILVQRSIARDLRIDNSKPIGQGRFGIVMKAEWNGDIVAVKSFYSLNEESWKRESEIYETCMLRHSNILGYIASDIHVEDDTIKMLLITEYHQLGSLYDYLQSNSLDSDTVKKFAYTIVNGLNHLHTEIFSAKYKPAIAHRDLKSKNILVKNNLECCIADFGLAVKFSRELNKTDIDAMQVRQGSHRYMAPECLNETLALDSIEDLKRADVYSYSLVLWEILRRYKGSGENDLTEIYNSPYYEYASVEPPIFQMRDLVCEKKLRPKIMKEKQKDPRIASIVSIIQECWQEEPTSRLHTLRIKKNIAALL